MDKLPVIIKLTIILFFVTFVSNAAQTEEVPDPSKRPAVLPMLEDVITDAQLLALQDALWCLNMTEKDMSFNKRPLEDDFRFSIVNNVLDEPLETAYVSHDINVKMRELISKNSYDAVLKHLGELTDIVLPDEPILFSYDLMKNLEAMFSVEEANEIYLKIKDWRRDILEPVIVLIWA
ncbi:MAG: hypothetical protein K8S87_03320, partial [Planctomycetes bacterium]|nr:hypothetical protein [Planctomycetota bacterium]